MKRVEEDEYRKYVVAHIDRLRRVAYLLCHRWQAADDLVAAAIGKLYRSWSRSHGVNTLDGDVRAILVQSWLDGQGRPWRRAQVIDETPDRPASDQPEVIDGIALLDVLAGLTPRHRAATVLRFYFDFSVSETAEILGCSAGTVTSLTARGLQAMQMRVAVPSMSQEGDTP